MPVAAEVPSELPPGAQATLASCEPFAKWRRPWSPKTSDLAYLALNLLLKQSSCGPEGGGRTLGDLGENNVSAAASSVLGLGVKAPPPGSLHCMLGAMPHCRLLA